MCTRLALLVSLLMLAVGSLSMAQDNSRTFQAAFVRHISGRLNIVAPDGSRVLPLTPPIPLTSIGLLDAQSTQRLQSLWSVPQAGDAASIVLGSKSVSDTLRDFFDNEDDFELGSIRLDVNGKAQLAKALEILFGDPTEQANPTTRFKRYRAWQTKRRAIVKEIAETNSLARKVSLNQELQLHDQNYMLTGEKGQIEAALQIQQKYATEASLFSAQREQLSEHVALSKQLESRGTFLKRLTSNAAWARESTNVISAKLPKVLTVTVTLDGGQQERHQLPLLGISYQAIKLPVDHPALTVGVFGNRAWRRRDMSVVSDGALAGSDEEIAPLHVSQALVVRNVELECDSASPGYRAFAKRIGTLTSGSINGIPLNFRGDGGAYVLVGHIYLPQPIVIGGVITSTPKSPNPLPNLEWK